MPRNRHTESLESRLLLTAPSISGLGLVNDTGTPSDGITSDATVGGTLDDWDFSGWSYFIEVDDNGDGMAWPIPACIRMLATPFRTT